MALDFSDGNCFMPTIFECGCQQETFDCKCHYSNFIPRDKKEDFRHKVKF